MSVRNRECDKTCDVQVSVILSGAKDHDFRFFGLRPPRPACHESRGGQNDNDKERLAHSVKTILFCFEVFFLSFLFPSISAPNAAAQEDSQTEIRFQKILADLRKSSDVLRKRNDFFRKQNEILRAKILPLGSLDLKNSDDAFILQLNEQLQKLKAHNNELLDKIAQKEQEDLHAQSKLKDFRERIMILKKKMAAHSFSPKEEDHPVPKVTLKLNNQAREELEEKLKEESQLRDENIGFKNKRDNGLMLFDQEIQQLRIQKEQMSGSWSLLQGQPQTNRLILSQFSQEEKRLKAQIASWQKQKKYLQDEVLKSMQTMVKLEKQKDKFRFRNNSTGPVRRLSPYQTEGKGQ